MPPCCAGSGGFSTKPGRAAHLRRRALLALALGAASKPQEQTQEPPREATTSGPDQQRQKADGERHGLPIETYAVASGTKFLVRLEEELGTKRTKENEKFKVKTLEPLEAGSWT